MATSKNLVTIIGAGFSGLGMAIQLKKAGIEDFIILERDHEVGGTWRDNHYPGAACDVPSFLYSYSFELSHKWSRMYAEQGEIQDYILHCTEKYKLRPYIQFGKEIVKSTFDENTGLWTLTTKQNESFISKFIVGATGPLANAKIPDFPGLKEFKGKVIHSSNWDDSYDFHDKKVALVGSGASAIQIGPEIAPIAKSMTIFQRSAPWIMPKPRRRFNKEQKETYRKWPILMRLNRLAKFWFFELTGPFVFHKGKWFKDTGEALSKKHIQRAIKDPEIVKKVTPNYRIGCKRVLISNNWYPSLLRPNVTLVNEAVENFSGNSIVSISGKEFPVDTVIMATGFDVPNSGTRYPIIGRKGVTLNDTWSNGACAYRGMTVSGFPNMFILLGPNTGPGHTSVLLYVETQIKYVIKAIQYCESKGRKFLDLRSSRLERYNEWLQKRMNNMIWTTGGCNSWYLTNTGKNTTLYPGFVSDYCLRASRFNPKDYIYE